MRVRICLLLWEVVALVVVARGLTVCSQQSSLGRVRRRVVVCGAKQPKWSEAVDELGERVESAKTAVVAGLVAGVAVTPVDFVLQAGNLPQWEFNADTVSVMGALFGLVFRYAVRRDANPQLRQGVVGAFALTRALSSVRVSETCSWAPLDCGGLYLDGAMAWQLGSTLLESGVAFYAAAVAVDYCADRGWLGRFGA